MQRKSESIDTKRGSGQSGTTSGVMRSTTQRVGGGGMIARKPPANSGSRRDSKVDGMSSTRSRAGLQIDTISSQSKVGTNEMSPKDTGRRYGQSNRSKDASNRSPRGSNASLSHSRSPNNGLLPNHTNSMKKLSADEGV